MGQRAPATRQWVKKTSSAPGQEAEALAPVLTEHLKKVKLRPAAPAAATQSRAGSAVFTAIPMMGFATCRMFRSLRPTASGGITTCFATPIPREEAFPARALHPGGLVRWDVIRC